MTTAAARAVRSTARATPATPKPATGDRPSLRLITRGPLVAGRLPFAVLVGGILAVGLVALLLLHTLAAQDAFRLQELQRQQAGLSDTEQQLSLLQQRRQAPGALSARAHALGMVATGSVAFVRLHRHGHVVGAVRAAAAPPAPTPAPTAGADTRQSPKPSTTPAAGQATTPAATTGAGTADRPAGTTQQHRPRHHAGR